MKLNENNSFITETKYDSDLDTLGIRITKPYEYKESVELAEGLILDFDINGVPVALEMLNASKRLNVPAYSLHNPVEINMRVDVKEDSISLKACFKLLIHQRQQEETVSFSTDNQYGIQAMNTELAFA